MRRQLFATKPLSLLLDEMKGENRLRRILGPVQLSSLGVGAIIGTGIFVLTGQAAHDKAGPALILSFVVSGIACIFAALCYAEFASMVPVAGSAYTYAYATMGELFAWIIGWDLVLEYTVVSATVAHGWSAYFQDFIGIFGLKVPGGLHTAPFDYNPALGKIVSTGTVLDLPAIVITVILTAVLIKGIRESASINTTMVGIKLAAVLFVIGVGAFYVNPANWHPFAPFGFSGISFFG
ncbi:MAG TPA: amino acid permease, partial [Thermoanaerobaculaceae bacterium]|nr:amino acid permease [Thermoanaerobaculaceae bacterium]